MNFVEFLLLPSAPKLMPFPSTSGSSRGGEGFCSGSRSGRVIYRGIICLDVNNLGVPWQQAGGQLPCLLHSCTFAAWGDPLGSQGVFLAWVPCSPIPLPILGHPCTLLGVSPQFWCPTPSLMAHSSEILFRSISHLFWVFCTPKKSG